MFSSLYTKLVLVLFSLFIVIGGVFLAAALYTAPMYQQEVSQHLNRDLLLESARAGGRYLTRNTGPDGRFVYAMVTQEGLVGVIDTETWEVVDRIPLGTNPSGIFLRTVG